MSNVSSSQQNKILFFSCGLLTSDCRVIKQRKKLNYKLLLEKVKNILNKPSNF